MNFFSGKVKNPGKKYKDLGMNFVSVCKIGSLTIRIRSGPYTMIGSVSGGFIQDNIVTWTVGIQN